MGRADKVHHGELPSLLGPQVNRARTATVCVLDQRERFSIVQVGPATASESLQAAGWGRLACGQCVRVRSPVLLWRLWFPHALLPALLVRLQLRRLL